MDGDKLRERLRAMRDDFTTENLPDNADGQVRRVCDRFALIASLTAALLILAVQRKQQAVVSLKSGPI
jgi:hypothetical protein